MHFWHLNLYELHIQLHLVKLCELLTNHHVVSRNMPDQNLRDKAYHNSALLLNFSFYYT